MASLIARTAFDGALPLEIGGVTAAEVVFDAMTSVAPFKGKTAAVSAALEGQIGAGLPESGESTGTDDARVAWAGFGQYFVMGPSIGPVDGAATTDQTDAWAAVALEGDGARDVLARMVPADLRDGSVAVGGVIRTLSGHMNAMILRTGDTRFVVLVFRSMAANAAHELETAMQAVAARQSA